MKSTEKEFPIKEAVEKLKMFEGLEETSLLRLERYRGHPKILVMNNFYEGYGGKYVAFLGKLMLFPPTNRIFQKFLNKFAQAKSKYMGSATLWKIEYGILVRAYEIFKKDPQELESITMTAKTQKDLKIHLGVS